jgi:hypothetical protein
MAKKVKNKDQDAHLKDIVLEVFNIAKSCKITSTPSTAHLRTTCKQGGETKGAYKITMKEILQNIIPSYLTLSSFFICVSFSHFLFVLFFLCWTYCTSMVVVLTLKIKKKKHEMKYYICYGVLRSFVCLHYFISFYKMDKATNKKVLVTPNSLNNNANNQGMLVYCE